MATRTHRSLESQLVKTFDAERVYWKHRSRPNLTQWQTQTLLTRQEMAKSNPSDLVELVESMLAAEQVYWRKRTLANYRRWQSLRTEVARLIGYVANRKAIA